MKIGLALTAALALAACAGGGTTAKKADAAEEADAFVFEHPDARVGPDARVFDAKVADGAAANADAKVNNPDAMPPAPDAKVVLPDAAVALVDLTPKMANVARTGTVTMTVTLPDAAGAGGQAVLLGSNDPAVTVPSSVIVLEGDVEATFEATGVNIATAVVITARVGQNGVTSEATIRVVPRILEVTPPVVNITLGQTGTVTVVLEGNVSGGPLTIDVGSDFSSIASVDATATIPNGQDSVDVTVSTVDLGLASIRAQIGNQFAETNVRVQGIFMSEILYDVTGVDDNKEWIELYNATNTDIDIGDFNIQVWLNGDWQTSLILSGTIPSGGCAVVGGPDKNGLDFTFLQEAPFDPQLGNAGSSAGDPGDGIQLRTYFGDVIDNVIYGRNNDDSITDEDGNIPIFTDIGDAAPDKTIERVEADINGAWTMDVDPNPGDCSAISK
jgi:hypothetical protein